jgi:hypothetical protein
MMLPINVVEATRMVLVKRTQLRHRWVFPPLAVHPRDRIGLGQWGCGSGVNLMTLTTATTPPIYSTVRRGPTSHVIGLDVPDQDARLGPRHGRWAKSSGDQLTFSPLISHSLLRSSISYSKF